MFVALGAQDVTFSVRKPLGLLVDSEASPHGVWKRLDFESVDGGNITLSRDRVWFFVGALVIRSMR